MKPYTLQRATAVSNGGHVFRRSGAAPGRLQGKALSVDHDDSCGVTFEAVYRDGVLVTSESDAYAPFPRVYVETSPGKFERLASLRTSDYPSDFDDLRRARWPSARAMPGDTLGRRGLHASDAAARARACRE